MLFNKTKLPDLLFHFVYHNLASRENLSYRTLCPPSVAKVNLSCSDCWELSLKTGFQFSKATVKPPAFAKSANLVKKVHKMTDAALWNSHLQRCKGGKLLFMMCGKDFLNVKAATHLMFRCLTFECLFLHHKVKEWQFISLPEEKSGNKCQLLHN